MPKVALCPFPKETSASHCSQEECRKDREKNALQEPPLPSKGERTVHMSLVPLSQCDDHQPVFSLQHSAAARKPAAVKDESFFGAFQGLSLDGLMGGAAGSPVSAPAAGGDPCKVM